MQAKLSKRFPCSNESKYKTFLEYHWLIDLLTVHADHSGGALIAYDEWLSRCTSHSFYYSPDHPYKRGTGCGGDCIPRDSIQTLPPAVGLGSRELFIFRCIDLADIYRAAEFLCP